MSIRLLSLSACVVAALLASTISAQTLPALPLPHGSQAEEAPRPIILVQGEDRPPTPSPWSKVRWTFPWPRSSRSQEPAGPNIATQSEDQPAATALNQGENTEDKPAPSLIARLGLHWPEPALLPRAQPIGAGGKPESTTPNQDENDKQGKSAPSLFAANQPCSLRICPTVRKHLLGDLSASGSITSS